MSAAVAKRSVTQPETKADNDGQAFKTIPMENGQNALIVPYGACIIFMPEGNNGDIFSLRRIDDDLVVTCRSDVQDRSFIQKLTMPINKLRQLVHKNLNSEGLYDNKVPKSDSNGNFLW